MSIDGVARPSDREIHLAGREDPAATLTAIADLARGCTRCRLHHGRTHAVPGEGPPDAALVLVGEAPGRTEDSLGRPFRGAAGRFLDRVLADLGVDRRLVFVTSVAKCRPPGNRAPLRDEQWACRPLLDRQLAAIAPRVVLAMGVTAAAALVPGVGPAATLATLRTGAPYVLGTAQLLVSSHPAAAMRFPAHREPFRADLARACHAAGLAGPRARTMQ